MGHPAPSFLVFYTMLLINNHIITNENSKAISGIIVSECTCNMSQLYCDSRVRFVKEGTLERKC